MFGDRTRSSGTPLLAVIVGSQQKTSSATIYTPPRFSHRTFALLFTSGDNITHPIVRKPESLYRDDAGEGGLIVSDQSFIHLLGCTLGLRHRVKGLLPFAEKSL